MSELQQEVQRLAAQAQADFNDRADGKLDLSEESLQIVEEMLAEASTYRDDLPSETVEGIVTRFGCYILEVGRQQFGGTYSWLEERNQPVLVVGNPQSHTALGTWDKVRGRLSGDAGDNIPFFFEGFAKRVRTSSEGSRALYI
ncbi:hypothetical protein JAO10_15425 [Burkholderia contaminans]|uniref:DUF3806 domain-containing protein n=1 Tax=Burkholderia contaminans TaxID=488447 RepID=A0AAP4QZI4_9BURK|nr:MULTISPECIES: hypothetical protein [Burkholderia]DAE46083.1 MAG TPA: protein of unknown function (DUF3806) [Caudoviricetes sp.]MBD1412354.1 hypothetical protein [Burkholderia contaminans]MBH9667943.1 hypothetical protein [Burkholderia contaminans]MBH9678706.1 hypothetical protein [Burkholderia contaminans]MBH9705461.1 hypothetical protein [Burkholderia contaminans]